MSTHQIIADCIALLSVTYGPKFPTNEQTLGVWIVLLQDLPPAELQAATIEWCRTQDWPPTPAELRKRCPSLCRCGECMACNRRIAKRIMNGPTKRIYGSGSAHIESPDWSDFLEHRKRLGPAQEGE